MSQIVVIATRNKGKVREMEDLFKKRGFDVRSLNDYEGIPEIEETGSTFFENALIKAHAVAHLLGVPVLADDSGLEVEGLGGEPGVISARYAGEHATDAENNAKLLRELSSRLTHLSYKLGVGHPPVWSAAEFVCSIVLVDPMRRKNARFEGRCAGYILGEARGHNGFGYDPYFYLPEYGQTMAELTLEEKNKISHRAKALRQLIELVY
ncbi:MAG: XTP/dITP diphosphatase [Paenibacillaceae bacterium]|jgi:XTP/dITP diphosphohydrolase|nr:XTP/dITP diphosphatase [Paenibacillaceae bacterium]